MATCWRRLLCPPIAPPATPAAAPPTTHTATLDTPPAAPSLLPLATLLANLPAAWSAVLLDAPPSIPPDTPLAAPLATLSVTPLCYSINRLLHPSGTLLATPAAAMPANHPATLATPPTDFLSLPGLPTLPLFFCVPRSVIIAHYFFSRRSRPTD